MIVLSIDPGIAHTGWAVIEFCNDQARLVESGVIKTTKKNGEDWERALIIAKELQLLQLGFYPCGCSDPCTIDTVLIEKYHFYIRKDHNIKNGEKTIRVIQAIETKFSGYDIVEVNNQKIRPHRKAVEPIFQRLIEGVKLPPGDHVQDAIYQALVWYYYIKPKEELNK